MPEGPTPDGLRRLDEEFRLAAEAYCRLASEAALLDIETRDLRLETDGDPHSQAIAAACVARAQAAR